MKKEKKKKMTHGVCKIYIRLNKIELYLKIFFIYYLNKNQNKNQNQNQNQNGFKFKFILQ